MTETRTSEESSSTIVIASRITAKNFRDFAVFDTLIRQKRLLAPISFTSTFLLFSVICVLLRSRAEQALLMAAVMLGIAIVFPAVYIGFFLRSVAKKAADLKLGKNGRHAYTLELSGAPDGIAVKNHLRSQGTLRVSWERVYHAFRRKDCIYLYVSERQAFLLPDGCASISDDGVWNFLKQHLAADKLTDRQKIKRTV